MKKIGTVLALLILVLAPAIDAKADRFQKELLVGNWQHSALYPGGKRSIITITFGPTDARGTGSYLKVEELEGQQDVARGTYTIGAPTKINDLAVVVVSIPEGQVTFHVDQLTELDLTLGFEGPPNGYQAISLRRAR
jgi:hypothetical protein